MAVPSRLCLALSRFKFQRSYPEHHGSAFRIVSEGSGIFRLFLEDNAVTTDRIYMRLASHFSSSGLSSTAHLVAHLSTFGVSTEMRLNQIKSEQSRFLMHSAIFSWRTTPSLNGFDYVKTRLDAQRVVYRSGPLMEPIPLSSTPNALYCEELVRWSHIAAR